MSATTHKHSGNETGLYMKGGRWTFDIKLEFKIENKSKATPETVTCKRQEMHGNGTGFFIGDGIWTFKIKLEFSVEKSLK